MEEARSNRGGVPRPSLLGSAVILSGVTVLMLLILPSVAVAVSEGSAVITQPGGTAHLNSGGSATEFGVLLPSGAKCPGDTAHDGYLIYSYLVPKGVSLTSLNWSGDLPFLGTAANPYFGLIAEGEYYGAINTDEYTGQVATLPAQFTWSRLTPDDLFNHGEKVSVWEAGIACATTHGKVANYWNSEIQFTASSSDVGGFTWKVLHQPASSIDFGLWISVALIAMAIAFGVTAVVLGRRQREGQLSTDETSAVTRDGKL